MVTREPGRQAGPVVWLEVMGQDADKLRSFYRDLLGWSFRTEPMTNHGIAAPEGGISGRVGRASAGQPHWVTFYTEVPDLEAAVARAVSLGSQVLLPPTRVPERRIAVVSDPEGHPVGLCSAGA